MARVVSLQCRAFLWCYRSKGHRFARAWWCCHHAWNQLHAGSLRVKFLCCTIQLPSVSSTRPWVHIILLSSGSQRFT